MIVDLINKVMYFSSRPTLIVILLTSMFQHFLNLFSEYGDELQIKLHEKTKQKTVPNVFINGNHVGGCSDVEKLHSTGELLKLVYSNSGYDYDAVVIGGGSGGIAAAKVFHYCYDFI